MDLAVYISELLGLEGEVNLPGIGCFTQVRINGYYNEQENKFYPPGHEVSFDPKFKEDENLAKFISTKKNISLASSKYFIDKYVAGLKQQLTSRNPEIGGLGYLYVNGAVVAFKADTAKASDPSFYGFQPLDIPAPVAKPVVEQEIKAEEEALLKPVEEVPVQPINEEVVKPEPTIIEENEELVTEEDEYEEPRSTRVSLWITLLLILIIVLLAVMGLYKYKPEWFNLQDKPQTIVIVKSSSDTTANSATDTSKTITSPDSTTKPAAQSITTDPNAKPADTAQTVHWEVIGGSFETQKAADLAIKYYKENGIDAKITTDVPGKRIKLILGNYFTTEQEAENAKKDFLKTGKVDKGIYTLKIKPKK